MKLIIDITENEWEYLNKLVANNDILGHYERLLVNGNVLEPCEDCVSRKQALIGIRNLYPGIPFTRQNVKKWKEENKKYFECENVIRDLPSVAPTSKVGKWIYHEKSISTGFKDLRECSCCKCYFDWTMVRNSYCPNCGAKMWEIPTGSKNEVGWSSLENVRNKVEKENEE